MNKTLIATLIAVIAGTAMITLMADEERGEREAGETREGRWFGKVFGETEEHRADSAWLNDPRHARYLAECGSCHLAYPPAMLPAVSWQNTLAGLADHFGENAELDAQTRAELEGYLVQHSAGSGRGEYAERMERATRGRPAPQRITETDYFVGQHHEIARNMVADNPQVKSFSRCEACHTRAAEGSFTEHEIRIPGYGQWDD